MTRNRVHEIISVRYDLRDNTNYEYGYSTLLPIPSDNPMAAKFLESLLLICDR